MGDEDWEAEITKPHVSSYVPVFEKVKQQNFKCAVINAMDFIEVENQDNGEVLNEVPVSALISM